MRLGFKLALALLFTGVLAAREPVTYGTIEQQTAAGPVRGLWAKIHLGDPAVKLGVTGPLAPAAGDPPGTEARLQPVNAWAEANGATLAINANFFSLLQAKPGPGEGRVRYISGAAADIVGLSRSEQGLVSPARRVSDLGDPALLVYADRARIACAQAGDLADVACAVAGIGATIDQQTPGDLLVTSGRNTGANARVAPGTRHPRTAAGVSADGRTLILVVIDGRRPAHSIGATLPELGDLLIELGAHDALALDGGGSTSFWLRRPDGSLLTNQPSDGQWRPVANHLGVWITWPKPVAAGPAAAKTAESSRKP